MSWESLTNAADRPKAFGKTKYGKHNRRPFQLVEKSIPLTLGDKTWFLRVIYDKANKQFLLDIREFELEQTRIEDKFKATTNGISLSVPHWYTILGVAFKLMRKFSNK